MTNIKDFHPSAVLPFRVRRKKHQAPRGSARGCLMSREVDVLAVVDDEILGCARREGSGFRTLNDGVEKKLIWGGR